MPWMLIMALPAHLSAHPPICVQRVRHTVSGKPTGSVHKVHILDGISSVLKSGRFTLLLGPPGAGKTLLMKALSGQLKREKGLKVGEP